jgi:hypothetical protein
VAVPPLPPEPPLPEPPAQLETSVTRGRRRYRRAGRSGGAARRDCGPARPWRGVGLVESPETAQRLAGVVDPDTATITEWLWPFPCRKAATPPGGYRPKLTFGPGRLHPRLRH